MLEQIYKIYPPRQKFFNEPDFFVAKNESPRHARRRLSLVWVFRRLPGEGLFLLEGCVGGRQACDGHAERRAAHVVQARVVAEFDRRRFAAVLAADAALEHRALAAALEYGLANQLSHAVLVEDLERVVLQDALVEVDRQELADVVAREAQRHLRQVVGAEREELGDLGNLVGGHGCAGNLDHRADHVVDLVVALREYLFGRRVDDAFLVAQP